MAEGNLAAMCLTAFAAVFTLLSLLAGVMEIIMRVFPQKAATIDQGHVAVITSTYSTLFPGARVTRIEESK